jgi:hypothetical protein
MFRTTGVAASIVAALASIILASLRYFVGIWLTAW